MWPPAGHRSAIKISLCRSPTEEAKRSFRLNEQLIFNFIGLWNEYFFALVFVNSTEKKTLPLGLASVSIQAQYKTDFGLLFAGLVIVLVPTLIVYFLLQRQITRGITLGALKG